MDRKRDDAASGSAQPRRPADVAQAAPEFLLNVFDSLDVALVAIDALGRVVAVNAAALTALKLNRRFALGRPVQDVLRSADGSGSCPLAEALASGQTLVGRESILLDGLGRPLAATLTTAPLRDASGRLQGAVAAVHLTADLRQAADPQPAAALPGGLVTGDPYMRRLFAVLPAVARSDASVLIQGEPGTGKTRLARAIHDLSPRRRAALVTVACADAPPARLRAELLGTGIGKAEPGLLARANGGTLFLQGADSLAADLQLELLRVLQEKRLQAPGDVRSAACDARFIAAADFDLEAAVAQGAFRRDLYCRLNILRIEVPPLRGRKGDIPLLVQRILNRLSQGRGKRVTGVSSRVLEILTNHDYPGNIRELQDIIEHAWVRCPSDVVQTEHLPAPLRRRRWAFAAPGPADRRPLPRVEAEYIREALARHQGHRGATARELGIHRTTLIRKIKRLGLKLPAGDGRRARFQGEGEDAAAAGAGG